MKKVIKKIGNSHVLIINKEDRQIHGLNEGDYVEIELSKIVGAIQND